MPTKTESISVPSHQLRFLDRAPDRFDGGVDIDHDSLAQSAGRRLAETDDFDLALRRHFRDDATDFGCADVQADNVVFFFGHVYPLFKKRLNLVYDPAPWFHPVLLDHHLVLEGQVDVMNPGEVGIHGVEYYLQIFKPILNPVHCQIDIDPPVFGGEYQLEWTGHMKFLNGIVLERAQLIHEMHGLQSWYDSRYRYFAARFHPAYFHSCDQGKGAVLFIVGNDQYAVMIHQIGFVQLDTCEWRSLLNLDTDSPRQPALRRKHFRSMGWP